MPDDTTVTMPQIRVMVAGAPRTGKSTILYVIFDALRAAGFTDVLVDAPDLFRHGFYRQQSNRVRYLAEDISRPITLSEVFIKRNDDRQRDGERLTLPLPDQLTLPEIPEADVIDVTPVDPEA